MYINIELYSTCLFLLYLLISGNFLGNTFSCATQRYLENRVVKQGMVFFSLFFFIKLINPLKKDHSPYYDMLHTIPIYIIFFISTKCNPVILLLFMVILFIIYYIYLHINFYYKHIEKIINNNKDEEIIKKIIEKKNINNEFNKYNLLRHIQLYLTSIGLIALLIGFYIYFIRQYQDHHLNWNWGKFFFGIEKCGIE
jgi:hypothetical protein